MTAHRTAGQLRALRELCALARTALDVADELQRRGAEEHDAPRLWLTSLERWARGEETPAQLAARTRAANAWGDNARKVEATASWAFAVGWLDDARGDLMRNPGHAWHTKRVARNLAEAWGRTTGETPDAATAYVAARLDEHRRRIAWEWATKQREGKGGVMAAARRAKADKVAAERALGTLPGMERDDDDR